MTAAVAHHETEVAMRKRLATTAEKLRSARRALDTQKGDPDANRRDKQSHHGSPA